MTARKDWLVLGCLVAAIIILALLIVNINLILPVPGLELPASSSYPMDTSRGASPNAAVSVVEFYNFMCSYCRQALAVDKKLIEYYGNNVNFVFKHFGSGSIMAEAAECARDQGKFFDYHGILFQSPTTESSSLKQIAGNLGLDAAKFDSCLDSGEKKDIVSQDSKEGVLNGVQGTPTYFVNGKKLEGYMEFVALKSAIDKELEDEV